MRYPDEPHTIVNGVAIHIGAIDMVDQLRASGHAVYLDEDGRLIVEGLADLHTDTQHLLDAFSEDIAILLRLSASTTVH